MPTCLKFALVFSAGVIVTLALVRPITITTESRDVVIVSPVATNSPLRLPDDMQTGPRVGGIVLGEVMQPGIPQAGTMDSPPTANPKAGERRAIERTLRALEQTPPDPVPSTLDDETTARIAEDVRSRLLAQPGEKP